MGVDGRIAGSCGCELRARVCVYVYVSERKGTAVRTKRTMGVEIETILPGDGKKSSLNRYVFSNSCKTNEL